jgi:hypothetical protein
MIAHRNNATGLHMTNWNIETHNYAGTDLPEFYRTRSVDHLRRQLQRLASDRRVGRLHFRYELDERNNEAVVVHAYFDGRNGRRRRFMRLRRAS